MESSTAIGSWLSRRADLLRLVLIAILLGLGVNLLASIAFEALAPSTRLQLVVGVTLVLIPLGYLAAIVVRSRDTEQSFEAVLLFDASKKAIVPVPQYEFSEDVSRIVRAVTAESKALNHIWEAPPLFDVRALPQLSIELEAGSDADAPRKPDAGSTEKEALASFGGSAKARQLLQDVLEFVALESLSTHLSEYFNHDKTDERHVHKVTRSDVPALLLENPVLSLISGPPAFREPFMDSETEDNVYAIFAGDYLYSKFELTLPRGARIFRAEPGTLRIDSPRAEIRLSARYNGFATVVPDEFVRRYCGIEDEFNVFAMLIHWKLGVRIKLRGLLSREGWEYYSWIDSFQAHVHEFASWERFLERISWPAVFALLRTAQTSASRSDV